jgi:hypothetical protein
MATYKEMWKSSTDPTVTGYVETATAKAIPIDPGNADYQAVLAWQAGGGVADPAFTAAEIDELDRLARQAARLDSLKTALIYQFKMILALFQVGKDKGLWVNTDFDLELRQKAADWIQLIADYEADQT